MIKTLALLLTASSAFALGVNPADNSAGQNITPATITAATITATTRLVSTVAGSTFSVGGLIFKQDYTQAATTTTATLGGAPYTFFSTATIAANTLVRNGDILRIQCAGNAFGGTGTFGALLFINSVAVSSKAVAITPLAGSESSWWLSLDLMKTSTGNQVRLCKSTFSGNCNGLAGSITSGTSTFDETAALAIACAGQNGPVTAGQISYLGMTVEYLPAP